MYDQFRDQCMMSHVNSACTGLEFKWLVKERGFGLKHFSRSFTLPEDIDGENVNATFKNGLLTITVPKKTETKTKKIAISA